MATTMARRAQDDRTKQPPNDAIQGLKSFLHQPSVLKAIREACADIDPKTVAQAALISAMKNDYLARCSPPSFLAALLEGARLRLSVDPSLGHAYLIPFKNQCKFMLGYRGMIQLAYRSPMVKRIDARVVYSRDRFRIAYHEQPPYQHEPSIAKDRGEPIMVYAVADLENGMTIIEPMSMDEVYSCRDRSESWKRHADKTAKGEWCAETPWHTDEGEMIRKTAIRRLAKRLPMADQLAQAIARDQAIEDADGYIDVESITPEVESTDAHDDAAPEQPAPPAKAKTATADPLADLKAKIREHYEALGAELGDKILAAHEVEGLPEVGRSGDGRILQNILDDLGKARMEEISKRNKEKAAAPAATEPAAAPATKGNGKGRTQLFGGEAPGFDPRK